MPPDGYAKGSRAAKKSQYPAHGAGGLPDAGPAGRDHLCGQGQKAEKQGDLLLPRGGAAPAEGLPYGGNGTGF